MRRLRPGVWSGLLRTRRRREALILVAFAALAVPLAAPAAPGPHSSAGTQAPPRPMSLDEAVEYALEHSPLLQAGSSRVDAAEEELRRARGLRLPQIGLFSSYAAFEPGELRVTPGSEFVNVDDMNSRFTNNFATGGIDLTLPLFTGGRLSGQVRLQEFGIELARQSLFEAREGLALNVTSLFHTILRLRETTRAVDGSLESLREAERVVRDSVDVGQLPEVELFKVQTRRAEVEQRRIAVDNAHRVAQTSLAVLMGLDAPLFTLETDETLAYAPAPVELEQAIQEARLRRPLLLAQDRRVQIQEQSLRIAQGELYPQVSLRVAYAGTVVDDTVAPGGDTADQGSLQVAVNFPLLDWGAIRGKIAAEKARLAAERREYEALRLQVGLEVQTALLNVLEAEQRMASAEAARREAQEVLRVEQMKLGEGVGIVQDVLDAQAAALRAEEAVFAATADALVQKAALEKAIGRLTRSVGGRP